MASGAKRRFSYTDQKIRRGKTLRALWWVLAAFLAYEAVTGLFLSPRVIGSKSMEPGFRPGDRIFVSPIAYGAHTPFSAKKLPGVTKPKRGDLVLVSPPYVERNSSFASFFRPLLRFVSFQLLGWDDQAVVKRVVGLPGDILLLKDSVVSVNPGGNSRFLTEFELSRKPYDLKKADLPEGWDASLPLSASFAEYKLGEDQYFLMNDDRGATNDSRSWGSVDDDRILGKVLMRYWPLLGKGER